MEGDMDIDPTISHPRTTDNNTLTDFATGAVIVEPTRPSLHDLKLVLISLGLHEDDADVLAHYSIQFIPLKLRTDVRHTACKDCGAMHGGYSCHERRKLRWQNTLPKTGWQAYFRSWEMRGWRLELDRKEWNLEKLTRHAKIPEPLALPELYQLQVSTRSTDYSNRNRGKSQPVPPIRSSRHASRTKQKLPSDNMDMGQREAKLKLRQAKLQLLEEKKRLHQERMLRNKMQKTMQDEQHQANELRYLRLHSRLAPQTGTMTIDDVREKFRQTRYVLVNEIERLERQECEAMIDVFAGVKVEDR